MLRGPVAGLPDGWVQAEITDQLLGRSKARDVADGGKQPHRHRPMHAADRHQPTCPVVSQGALGECLIKRLQVGCPLVEIGQIPPHRNPLIASKRQSVQPGPTGQAEQLALEGRDQVGVQHRMQPVLDPRPLLDDLSSLRDQSPERFGGLIRHPNLRQKPTGMQLGEYRRIDLVGLDLGMRDRAYLQRLGNHHTMHERLQYTHDPCGIHRRLDHDLIVWSKPSTERNHGIPRELDPSSIVQSLIVEKHRHRKTAVHLESDDPHITLL